MLRELLSIFRPGNPLIEMAAEFARMIGLTCDMTVKAGDVYFGESVPPEGEETRRAPDARWRYFRKHHGMLRALAAEVVARTNIAYSA